MQISLYQNTSENYRIDKTLTGVMSADCTLKDGCSIENPILLLSAGNLTECNYLYIADFNRYYFITDVVSVRNGLWEISAHVDVLMSFKDEIKACTATFKRQENLFNMYLDDPEFKTYNKSQIVTKVFSGGALTKNMEYVLVVAGG